MEKETKQDLKEELIFQLGTMKPMKEDEKVGSLWTKHQIFCLLDYIDKFKEK